MNASLDSQIKRLRKRVRFLLAERYGLFGTAAGAVVSVVLVLLSPRYDILLTYELWASAVILGAAVGVAYALLRCLDDLTVAIAADKRTGLKERLSTAVALQDALSDGTPLALSSEARAYRSAVDEKTCFDTATPLALSSEVRAYRSAVDDMSDAVVTDASSKIAALDSSQVFKHRFGLPHIVCGAALFVLLAAIIVPLLPVFQSATRRQEVAVMKTEGKKLVRIAKEIRNQDNKQEEMRKLSQKLGKLGSKMETGRMSRKQAMLKAQRLAKDIKREQDRLARENSNMKSMEQARADMRKASENLAKSMADKLAKRENIPPEEALKKVPSDEQLAALARKEGPLTASEQKQLEDALTKYADPSSGLPIPAELGEALAKLAQNKDYQKAAELMRKLAQKMNSGNMSKADKEMLKKQMEALAKALKNTDLDKLAKAMLQNAEKLAQMSPEELQKMMEQMKQMQQMAQQLAKAGAG